MRPSYTDREVRYIRFSWWTNGFAIGFVAGAILCLMILPMRAHADICLQSTNSTKNDETSTNLSYPASGNYSVPADCTVTSITAWLNKAGSPGVAHYAILSDSAGTPSTELVASTNIDQTLATGQLVSANVSNYCLHSGDNVHVSLVTTVVADGVNYWIYGLNNTGNSWWYNNGTWHDAGGEQFIFEADGDLGCSASLQTNSPLMRAETIQSTAFAIFMAMLIYFAIRLFTPKKRQR